MAAAYVDASTIVAIVFGEPAADAAMRRLRSFHRLVASNLLEAEVLAACAREGVTARPPLLDAVVWVLPDRPLSQEIGRVLDAGPVRGANLWHLATALFVASSPGELAFVTLDRQQEAAARKLGFS